MFNENQESRILQNDTDSAFFTMQGTVLQDVMVHSPEAFPKAFANFLVILRNRLNENLRTSQGSFSKISVADLLEHEVEPDRDQGFLMMECEEIVVSNFTSFAKKSYARCDAIAMKRKGQKDVPFSVHLAETMKMITENGKMDLELMKKA